MNDTRPTVLIIAGGDISRKLPYLRAGCSCPALIPVNTRPLASYVMDVYRGNSDIHLFIDEAFSEEVSAELPPRKHGFTLHGIRSGEGVMHTLREALNTPGVGEDVTINLVTTVPPHAPLPNQVQVAPQSARESDGWSAIHRSEEGNLSFHYKGKPRPPEALAFTGVFRLPARILRLAAEAASSENDLLSVIENASRLSGLNLETVEWVDCGHETNYYKSRASLINSRSFNSLKVDSRRGVISKFSKDKSKLFREASYLENLPSSLRVLFPRLIGHSGVGDRIDSYEMEYYGYPNLAEYLLYWNLSKESWWRCFDSLNDVLGLFRQHPASIGPRLYDEFHWKKSLSRIDTYLSSLPDPELSSTLGKKPVRLNGKPLQSLPQLLSQAETVLASSYRESNFSVFHGDFCFNNILFDVASGIVRLIDPRGSFGDGFPGIFGDWRYDLSKLSHSATGHYDYFVNGLFDVWSSGTGNFDLQTVQRPHGKWLPEMMSWLVREQNADHLEIQVITGLLFLSMCPLHDDDPSRQLAFFLRGLEILNDSFNQH